MIDWPKNKNRVSLAARKAQADNNNQFDAMSYILSPNIKWVCYVN